MPIARKVWAESGTRPKGIFWWSNKKANMFGALINGKKLHYEWYNNLNAHSFVEFLTRFVQTLDISKKYVFVLDNGPAHRAKMSQVYMQSLGANIMIEFLPPYSPQLNCIETSWKIVRYNVTNSNLFQTIDDLKKGVQQFVDTHNFMLNPSNYLSR